MSLNWIRISDVYDVRGCKVAVVSVRSDGLCWAVRSSSKVHRFKTASAVSEVLRRYLVSIERKAFVDAYTAEESI